MTQRKSAAPKKTNEPDKVRRARRKPAPRRRLLWPLEPSVIGEKRIEEAVRAVIAERTKK